MAFDYTILIVALPIMGRLLTHNLGRLILILWLIIEFVDLVFRD